MQNAGEFRIRHDRVDKDGKVTLRYTGSDAPPLCRTAPTKPHESCSSSRTGTCGCSQVKVSLLRELTINPERKYQGQRSSLSAMS